MNDQLKRLAEIAESLERQAAELRAELTTLAEDAPPDAVVEPTPVEEPAVPEGARVVALSMAFDEVARDEAARRLKEEFGLDDVEQLLDDAYSRAAG